MIDIHTHILPEIDDGARSLKDAAELIRSELYQDVSEIVFTPHYYGRKRSLEQFFEMRAEAMEKLKPFIPEVIKTRLGAEVYLTGVNDPSNDALCSLAIEGTKCVLVEFPFSAQWRKSLFLRIAEFVADTGYTPIVAHVERYEAVLKDPAILTELVDMGCLIQMNTQAFLNRSTKRFAYALLKHGLVHCLGTDTHNSGERAPDYRKAEKAVCAAGFEKEWERLQENMQKILNKERVQVAHTPIKKIFGLYF